MVALFELMKCYRPREIHRRCKIAQVMRRPAIDLPPVINAGHSGKPGKFTPLAKVLGRNDDGASKFETAMAILVSLRARCRNLSMGGMWERPFS